MGHSRTRTIPPVVGQSRLNGRGQAPTLRNVWTLRPGTSVNPTKTVAEGLVPSRKGGGGMGSPRDKEPLPGPGMKVKPPLLHPEVPRPNDHLLSLDGRG